MQPFKPESDGSRRYVEGKEFFEINRADRRMEQAVSRRKRKSEMKKLLRRCKEHFANGLHVTIGLGNIERDCSTIKQVRAFLSRHAGGEIRAAGDKRVS